MTIFWFCLMAVLLIIEVVTIGLTAIWFALGALVAVIFASLDFSIWVQIIAFILVSGLTLAFTRPLAQKFLNSKRKATNADRLLNMVGVVTEDIDNVLAKGTVSIGGKLWSARSAAGESIGKNTEVKPVRIEGVKLIVVPVKETADLESK